MIRLTVLENMYTQMEQFMKDSGSKIGNMVKAQNYGLMVLNIKVALLMVTKRVKGN